jgi:type I restriction enzyme S subunit
VSRVTVLLSVAERMDARFKHAQDYFDKLTQSILAKAFKGELVPQDPNDEPAEKLLKSIRNGGTGKRHLTRAAVFRRKNHDSSL